MDSKILKSKQGFTIVELLVVIVLASLVFLSAFQLMQTSYASYRSTAERVDAQSQFRLIIGILEQETGTATSVLLMTSVPDTVEAGYACIYVKSDGDVGKFYKKTSAGEEEFVTPYPLKDLTMTFERATSKNILTVRLHAKVTNDYIGNIYTQNSSMINVDPGTIYTVVYYKILNADEL
jgi:prepilin-type N-terminal cleavage/methylation domain-containing protein